MIFVSTLRYYPTSLTHKMSQDHAIEEYHKTIRFLMQIYISSAHTQVAIIGQFTRIHTHLGRTKLCHLLVPKLPSESFFNK